MMYWVQGRTSRPQDWEQKRVGIKDTREETRRQCCEILASDASSQEVVVIFDTCSDEARELKAADILIEPGVDSCNQSVAVGAAFHMLRSSNFMLGNNMHAVMCCLFLR